MRTRTGTAVAVLSAFALVGAFFLASSISGATGTTIDPLRTLDVSTVGMGGAFAVDKLFIVDTRSQPGGSILTVDPSTGAVLSSLSTPSDLFLQGGIEVDAGTFLVAGGSAETTNVGEQNLRRAETDFQRIDMTTGAVIESFHTQFTHHGDIAVIGHHLYALGYECPGSLIRVDLLTPGENTDVACSSATNTSSDIAGLEKAGTNLIATALGGQCTFGIGYQASTIQRCMRIYTLTPAGEVVSYAELNREATFRPEVFACGNGELFVGTAGQTTLAAPTKVNVYAFPTCGPANTSPGTGITVAPVDPVSGQTPATIDFGSVASTGTTTVTSVAPPPASLPSGFQASGNFYKIATTATFIGPVTVCLTYDPIAFPAPQLWHYDNVLGWEDITTSVNPLIPNVCGTTDSFSPFAVVRQQAVNEVRAIATNSRSANPNNNIAVNLADSVAVGETLTVSVATGTFNGAVGCTDTKGNSYVIVADKNTGNGRVFVCSTAVTAALTTGDAVTATYPGFSGVSVASANAITGLTTGAGDGVATASGSNPAINSGNVSTSNAHDVLFAAISHTGTSTFAPGAGYTIVGAASSGSGSGKRTITPMFRLVTTTGSYAATGTLSGSGFWQAALIAYRAP